MTSSEWPKLDSALGGLEGLSDDVRLADETTAKYLREKFGELLVNEHRKKSGSVEDEAALLLWASQIANRVVPDASALYNLLDLQLKHELGDFWERLELEEPSWSPKGERKPSAPPPTEDKQWNLREGRRFHCTEGCEFSGEELYLAHRDRGHHPVPI